MLSLRLIRRFCNFSPAAIAIASKPFSSNYPQSSKPNSPSQIQNPKSIEPPALEKIKADRDPDKPFQLFKANAQNRLVIENRFAFEDTVSRLAGACRFNYIEELLEQQKNLPQGRREGFIVRIIMLYGKAGMTKHAVDTFYDMHLYGCRRTAKSFNAALKALTQTQNLEAIEEFIKEVPIRFGIEMDIFSVNIVIKALCEFRLLRDAYLVMLNSEKMGIEPDVITYTTIISAFFTNNKWEIGNGFWNRMVLKGRMPNLATYNVRIQFLVNKRRALDASTLMDTMQRVGIAPDEVTYNLVIKGFCQAGYLDMAKRVYFALHDKGYRPNVKIYQTMIHYLCKGEDYNLAYTMCKNCMEKNWFPNVDTICSLLEGLRRRGQIDKAKFIMKLARSRKPPFSSNQLDDLQSKLARRSNQIGIKKQEFS